MNLLNFLILFLLSNVILSQNVPTLCEEPIITAADRLSNNTVRVYRNDHFWDLIGLPNILNVTLNGPHDVWYPNMKPISQSGAVMTVITPHNVIAKDWTYKFVSTDYWVWRSTDASQVKGNDVNNGDHGWEDHIPRGGFDAVYHDGHMLKNQSFSSFIGFKGDRAYYYNTDGVFDWADPKDAPNKTGYVRGKYGENFPTDLTAAFAYPLNGSDWYSLFLFKNDKFCFRPLWGTSTETDCEQLWRDNKELFGCQPSQQTPQHPKGTINDSSGGAVTSTYNNRRKRQLNTTIDGNTDQSHNEPTTGGQETQPEVQVVKREHHFCELLRDNNNQIDYTLSVPHRTYYSNYIFIKGYRWKVELKSIRKKRQSSTDATTDSGTDSSTDSGTDSSTDSGTDSSTDSGTDSSTDSGTDSSTDSGTDSSGSPSIPSDSNELIVRLEYGRKFEGKEYHPFFDIPFKCAFAIRHIDSKDPNKWTTNVIGGVTEDWSKVKYVEIRVDQKHTSNDGSSGDTSTSNNRRKRQLDTTTDGNTDDTTIDDSTGDTTIDGSADEPIDTKIREFETHFKSFEPQVGFTRMAFIESTSFGFIETKVKNKVYTSNVKGFNLPNLTISWTEITKRALTQFRRRRQSTTKHKLIPNSIWNMLNSFRIKGVFPITMENSESGTILVIEDCDTHSIPCTGNLTYKYCVIADEVTNGSEVGEPCDPKKLLLLRDCNLEYAPLPTLPIPTTTDEYKGDGNTLSPDERTGGGPDGKEVSPTPSAKPSKGGMGWLWILIVIIIIMIIIIILLVFCCCKGKGKQDQGAAPPTGADSSGAAAASGAAGSGAQPSPSSIGSKKSASGGGLSKSSSTTSVASVRSRSE